MIDEPIDGQPHLDWLDELGLYETQYFVSFYYIEIDAIGPEIYDDDDMLLLEEWLYGAEYEDWEAGRRKQLKDVRQLNKRHAHRFRKKNGET